MSESKDHAMFEMDEFMNQVYMKEIVNQGRAAGLAIDDYDSAIQAFRQDGAPPTDRLFAAVQAFLSSAALISKLLWSFENEEDVKVGKQPNESKLKRLRARDRALTLRSKLHVGDVSPLKSRAVRNSFELFDERLDGYFAQGAMNVVDRAVFTGDSGLHTDPPPRFLRTVELNHAVASVLEKSVSLPDLLAEIRKVGERAKICSEQLE